MAKEEEKEQEDTEKKSGLSTVKIVIIAVVLSGVIGGGLVGGTFYFVNAMNEEAEAAAAEAEAIENGEMEAPAEPVLPPKYHSMDPKFIVSFNNQKGARFMQFSLEVMSRDDEVIKQLDDHMPVIRSSLLMLFGGQTYEVMVTREGKQKLLQEAVEDINNSLKMLAGDKEQVTTIEAAYFNSFVIQ